MGFRSDVTDPLNPPLILDGINVGVGNFYLILNILEITMRIVTVNGHQFFFESDEQQSFQIGHQENHNFNKRTVINNDDYITKQEIQQEFREPLNLTSIEFGDEGYFTERRDTHNAVGGQTHQNGVGNNEEKYFTEQATNGISDTGNKDIRESDVTLKSKFLEAHNKKRALHRNTPPLQWDEELADASRKWAEKLIKENGGKMKHCKTRGENTGENIFVAMQTNAQEENGFAEKAIDEWYSEINKYNPSRPSGVSGHFTQVVWAESTHVGVGFHQAKIGKWNTTMVVARYKPAGNMMAKGYYERNVNPLK